jgi:zinc protease
MLMRRLIVLSLAADLLLAAPLAAQSQTPATQAGVTRETLPNGLRVVVVRDPLAPVVTVYDNYLVGASDTPPGFPGMAHAQEHMAFRGCSGVDGDQTSAIFAQLGGDGDADTQQNVTQYFATVPASDLGVALRVDSACMRDIEDSHAAWLEERGAIEQEVARDLSNPQYKAFSRIIADAFAGTPYAHDALGTRASFQQTTGALLKSFYRKWYAPNNAILVIAGDVDPQRTLDQVRALYGSIPRRHIGQRAAVSLRPVKPDSFTLDSDLPYTVAYTAYRLPGSDDHDFAAAQILSDVLSSQRADLYGLVPQGKALYAGFELAATYPKAGLGFLVGALPPNGNANTFVAEAKQIIANYAKNGVPAELVDAAKRAEIAQSQFSRNSISELAATWSEALATEGRTSPDEDIDAIRAVSVDDVNRVLRTYVASANSITAILVPRPSGKPVASKGFGGGERLSTPPKKPVVLPEWAQAQLAKLEVPNSTLSPTDETLPNGIRLIVQPATASRTVTVVGEVRHNELLQTPPGKDGDGDVLDQLLTYGSTSLDRVAFQKALDDIAAQESAGTSFSLRVLTEHFDRGVELLADNVLHPGLPSEAFPIVRKQTADTQAGVLTSPEYLRQRAIERALYPAGDPALRQTTPETISGLTLDDVRSYYHSVFRPDMTTIVVIGDVTPASAKTAVAKWFGDWKAAGPKPHTDLAPVPANRPSSTVVPDAQRVQDQATLVESLGVVRSDPDYYALQLGDHVLGGGFYATRLYHDLRQKTGLVYSVENRFTVGKTRSTYSVSYGCDPPNVSKARRLVEQNLRAMQRTDVSPQELQQAKAILLRQLPLAESSEDEVANGLVSRATTDLPLDEPHRAAVRYAALGAPDIRAAFAKWVRPDGFVQVVQGPPPG